jgi:hypothetical protein
MFTHPFSFNNSERMVALAPFFRIRKSTIQRIKAIYITNILVLQTYLFVNGIN